MHDAVEIDRVSRTLFSWSRYSPDVKADLFSTAVIVAGRAFVVDPIATPGDVLRLALAPATVGGVIITNENHARVAAELAEAFAVPVYAHPDAREGAELPPTLDVADAVELALGLRVIAIDGAPAGEIAIHAAADGGSLIIGDALINMGSYGFTFLPAKYCRNQKRMRRSLRKLLDYDFERIAFAHGLPIVTNAKSRLEALLDDAA